MKIAFWDNSLNIRGTTVALYDYAFYNRTVLGNESIVIYNVTEPPNDKDVINKFEKEFKVIGVTDFDKVDDILQQEKCDLLYVIEGGDDIRRVSKVCKVGIHCVFNSKQPHGDVYATIAPWVEGNDGKYPYVPHMVNLPDNTNDMRAELNIPQSATVFGRHGGFDEFNIEYVRRTVFDVASSNPNIYFLFVNTRPFCNPLPNIIHLDAIADLAKKVAFINTCDAMIWGRMCGEVFSCSMGEFSIKNKPIFCTREGILGHVHLLGEKAFWYNEHTLRDMMVNFNKDVESKKDWNCYKEYTPENVMQIFKKVFID
jgi:hypothetical protein